MFMPSMLFTLRSGKTEIWVVNGQSSGKVIPQGMCVAFAEPFCPDCIDTICEISRVPTEISETKESLISKMIPPELDANQKRMLIDVLQKLIHIDEKAIGTSYERVNLIDGILCKKYFDPNGREMAANESQSISVLKFYNIFMTASTTGHHWLLKNVRPEIPGEGCFFWPGLYREVYVASSCPLPEGVKENQFVV
ncbi:retrovirus-related Pol polyprotein from transposon 297 [Trichonephila clavipes]|nr:retrovirus-related Pol polyprotein from transposon 297 [Trichonephila clavipes]